MKRTATLAVTAVLFGCSGAPVADGPEPTGLSPVSRPTIPDDRPAALVDGRRVTWGRLRPRMAELSGAAVLDEIILEQRLREELEAADIRITDADTAREENLLLSTLNPDPDVAARLLLELRTRTGLGPVRFKAMLFQNAALRALVADASAVTEADLRVETALRHGPRRQARLILVGTAPEAGEVLAALEDGVDFARLATERSTDVSAARGGLLEPISRSDSTYPDVLRDALFALEVGGVSEVLLLDSQHAILRLEREIPATEVDVEAMTEELIRQARLRKQRVAMDALARSLLTNVPVVIFDDSLNDAWEKRKAAESRR